MLLVRDAVQPTLYDVPHHGSFCPSETAPVTTSVVVATGDSKPDGGSSWLFEFRLEFKVGLNTPAAEATRVSLICGSMRAALQVHVVVERHLHRLVDGQSQGRRRLRPRSGRSRPSAMPSASSAIRAVRPSADPDAGAGAGPPVVSGNASPLAPARPRPKIRIFEASSNSE